MPIVSFIIGAVAGFVPTAVLFLFAGTMDIIICINLCSKKRFLAMKKDEAEDIVNEKVIGDNEAC